MTYDEFANSGKLGCANCYDVFSDPLEQVLKKYMALLVMQEDAKK